MKWLCVIIGLVMLVITNYGCNGCGEGGKEKDGGDITDLDTIDRRYSELESLDTIDAGTDTGKDMEADDTYTYEIIPCTVDEFIRGEGCEPGMKCTTYFPEAGDPDNFMLACMPENQNMGEFHEDCELIPYSGGGVYDSCAPGYVCLHDPVSNRDICEKLCSMDNREECEKLDREAACIWNPGIMLDPESRAIICKEFDDCDILCQTGCDEGYGCYVGGDGLHYGTVCAPFIPLEEENQGMEGDECEVYNNCQPGYICNTALTPPSCEKVCDLHPGVNDNCEVELCITGQSCTVINWVIETDGSSYTPDQDLGVCE